MNEIIDRFGKWRFRNKSVRMLRVLYDVKIPYTGTVTEKTDGVFVLRRIKRIAGGQKNEND